MVRIIAIASAKGGVGKTTLVTNLATALAGLNKSVIAVDGNLTTSNLSLHLGMHTYPVTLQDVIKGRARVNDAIYHHPSGFRVIPADISLNKILTPYPDDLVDVFYKLMDSDFILIDSAAGLGAEAISAVQAADEVITITTPELPAVIDALKLKVIAQHVETGNLGIIINRVKNRSHEIGIRDIKEFLDLPLLGVIPEDNLVGVSIANRTPLLTFRSKSKAGEHIKSVAARLIGEYYRPKRIGLFGWFR